MSEKVFREIRTQVKLLESRGVTVKNKKMAKRVLLQNNYYNIINGYKEPFIDKTYPYEKYKAGTTFNEIYALSEFDRNLRKLTFEYILGIEKQIKSITAYCFSKEHGHRNYLQLDYFDTSFNDNFKKVNRLLRDLHGRIYNNIGKEDSIEHYVKSRNYIPLWVLVNSISFGDISKFYSLMLPKEKNEVAKRVKFGLYPRNLTNYLQFLTNVRNRCAHDERLYSFRSHTSIPDCRFCSYFKIKREKNNYFSTVIAFKHLLSKLQFESYLFELNSLFLQLEKELHTISLRSIRTAMGFPNRWKKIQIL